MSNGQILVLQFDDGEDADKFRAVIDGSNGIGMRTLGVFMTPDDPCTCTLTYKNDGGNNEPLTVAEPKTGWRICLKCFKPRAYWGNLNNQIRDDEVMSPPEFTHTSAGSGKQEQAVAVLHYLGIKPVVASMIKRRR